ncbi:MAG: Hsp70 family protein, partial [Candidatus Nanopelagicales bacterium]|nr:Hsp70 family protein [Candidatus Nanopelagicales bacterium]
KDLATGKEQKMTISGGSALPKDDIDRMMRDAEAHAAEDHARREEAEIRNTAESLVYQTDKFLRDNEDKIPTDAKANVDEPLATLKKALEGTDIEAIKDASEKVATASQALGAAMYAQAQQSAPAGGAEGGPTGGASGAADEDVIDAEIVDEGEQK